MRKLAIAERFHSIQGEGTWTGTPMFFLRLAGCSVGEGTSTPGVFICHRYDGKAFICDTDYRAGASLTVSEALSECWEDHVCLTGGEPLNQPVAEVEKWCEAHRKRLHIETSGTVWPKKGLSNLTWVTVSPKQHVQNIMIHRADEVKLLVDEDFEVGLIPPQVLTHRNVWLSPINGVPHIVGHEHVGYESDDWINNENLQYALNILESHPEWRLSVQTHKYLGLR